MSADAGLTGLVYSSESAHSLGVNWVDIDGDLDIYTDNSQWVITRENQPDGPPNLLLHNRLVENGGVIVPGEPLFREAASLAGVDDQASPPFGKLSGHRTKVAA